MSRQCRDKSRVHNTLDRRKVTVKWTRRVVKLSGTASVLEGPLVDIRGSCTQRPLHSFLQQDAAARHTDFVREHPHLAERVPQYHIASYLGISEVSLSRLKRARISRAS